MTYLSVCSGIEAATVAWHPLGWTPAGFAEIEKFPSAVLKTHYPDVPNHGDMTKFQEWPLGSVDVLVGGTPCQSFSVAGLRAGLADPRGSLMLTYLALARRLAPRWIVWENVPGVLSSDGGRDFAAFLFGLGECGYRWAYRVLDAQYFGLAQRRKRVFVVGHLGDWRRAAAVLFERESLHGHPAPRRETGQTAPTMPGQRTGGGGPRGDFWSDGGLALEHVPEIVPQAISAKWSKGSSGPADDEVANLVSTLRGIGDYGDGLPSLRANGGDCAGGSEALIAHALKADGFDASEDGTGRGTPLVFAPTVGQTLTSGGRGERGRMDPVNTDLVAFSVKDHGADAGELAPTLRGGGHDKSHANGGVMPAISFGAQMSTPHWQHDLSDTVQAKNPKAAAIGMQVRRLTPRECERLQGFPDDYTLIPYRGKPAADGPRYKALGNSMAVPVMRWIGERIALVDSL